MGRTVWFGSLIISSTFALGGCYSQNMLDAPHPAENVESRGNGWNKYVSDIAALCSNSGPSPVLGREENFHQYLRWMNEITGKEFDVKRFHIISDSSVLAFLDQGFVGLFVPNGIYWYGDILMRNSPISIRSVAHEFGHSTDAHMNYFDYVTSYRSRVRTEAVAEAFENYIGLELMKTGNLTEGEEFILKEPTRTDCATLDDMIDSEGRYTAAQNIFLILMNEFTSAKGAWYFLATSDEDTAYSKAQSIINGHTLDESIRSGHTKLMEEKEALRTLLSRTAYAKF